MTTCYTAIDNQYVRLVHFTKSGTKPDDLLKLSCRIYFIIIILCPDGRATARLGNTSMQS